MIRGNAARAITILALAAGAAHAQGAAKRPAVGPRQAAPSKSRAMTLSFTRPGAYDYWTMTPAGPGETTSVNAARTSGALSVPANVTELDVADGASGLVAVFPAARMAGKSSLSISPSDFTRLRLVKVSVSAGGKPVEKALVSFADAAGVTVSRQLTAEDGGTVGFSNVPLGQSRFTATAGAQVTTTATVALSPGKGGATTIVPLALAGDVPTLSPTPATGALPAAPAASPPARDASAAAPRDSNSWAPGIIGLALLGAAAYAAVRVAKSRGVTVEDALKRLGVETPASTGASPLPLRPLAAPPPPLASLADLPFAGAAGNGTGSPTATRAAGPCLIGVSGPVSGENFLLSPEIPLTVGRDVENALALSSDTAISRQHARFTASPGGWEVVDAGSSNGTFVNGARVETSRMLRSGDEIQIGGSRFRFEA